MISNMVMHAYYENFSLLTGYFHVFQDTVIVKNWKYYTL